MAISEYQRNPKLKKINTIIDFSDEEKEEYIKCATDMAYFIRTYMKIIHVDRGLIPFDMYEYQEKMIKNFDDNRFTICKLPRQSGKSTAVIAYFLWKILFTENYSIAFLANRASLARKLLGRLQKSYESLPKWLQQGVVVWNKGDIELENGSKIVADSTTGSSVRGESYSAVFMDEFAHIKSHIAEEFFASTYPTISSGKNTKIVIVSTPKGMNLFYKMWLEATEKRSKFIPIEINWWDTPGRDEAWKAEQIANTSERQFSEEFECSFLGSIGTLIAAETLQKLTYKKPIFSKFGVDIYEKPIPNHLYVLIADTSHGVGFDYSAFCVFDITELPYRLVAKYRDNEVPLNRYPNFIYQQAKHYNEAYVLCELNDAGVQVAEDLDQDLEYENILTTMRHGRKGQILTTGFAASEQKLQLGVKTSKAVKRIGSLNFKDILENDKLIIEDFETILEITNFVEKRGSYEADDGHDDLVMCCVLFGWLSRQPYFKELTNIDFRQKLVEEKQKQIDDEVVPFLANDGINQEIIKDDKGQIWFPVENNSLSMDDENGFFIGDWSSDW